MTQRILGWCCLAFMLSAVGLAADLPLRKVVLFSNGVGYFERSGAVRDQARVELAFKHSEIDDVLKSLLVLDLGKGKIGAVTYDSSVPGSVRLDEIPFAVEGHERQGLETVLSQLQGVRVAVTTTGGRISGSVLTVGTPARTAPNDPSRIESLENDSVLVLASEDGTITRIPFADLRSVQVLDQQSRSVLSRFLSAKVDTRRREGKKLVITSDGQGERSLLVGYSLAAPIWKTTYRVVMREGKPAFFQGWAIVDNVSDEDWTDVNLSLVSGTPISFIQPLQQPLFMHRPVIPVADNLYLYPQKYEPEGGSQDRSGLGYAPGVPGGMVGGVPGGVVGGVLGGVPRATAPPAFRTSISDLIADQQAGIGQKATGKEVGDLFEYKIEQPISLARNSSALIPILQTEMEAERISIFRMGQDNDRPRSGLALKNNSRLTLEAGSMTILDGDTYAGEALLERLKPQERRFISFGVDLGTLVNSHANERRQPVFLVRIKAGALQAHYCRERSRTYEIGNQTNRPTVLYIEHPREAGWTLAKENQSPAETTARHYRFRVELAPDASSRLTVTDRQTLMDTIELASFGPNQMALFLSQGQVDETTKAKLTRLLEAKQKIGEVESRVKEVDADVREISEDQSRLRDNVKALETTKEARQLITRYVTKVNDQENEIENLRRQKAALEVEREARQKELQQAIDAFGVEP